MCNAKLVTVNQSGLYQMFVSLFIHPHQIRPLVNPSFMQFIIKAIGDLNHSIIIERSMVVNLPVVNIIKEWFRSTGYIYVVVLKYAYLI